MTHADPSQFWSSCSHSVGPPDRLKHTCSPSDVRVDLRVSLLCMEKPCLLSGSEGLSGVLLLVHEVGGTFSEPYDHPDGFQLVVHHKQVFMRRLMAAS